MYVRVPADCGEQLVQDGFDEVEISRSPDEWAQVVQLGWSVGEHVLADVGGLVGIYAAREQLRELGGRLAFWASRRTAAGPQGAKAAEGRSVILTLTPAEGSGTVSLECPVGADGKPAVDVDTLTRTLTTMLDAAGREPAAEEAGS